MTGISQLSNEEINVLNNEFMNLLVNTRNTGGIYTSNDC